MKKVLLTGITGYLGSFVAEELQNRSYFLRAVAPNAERLKKKNIEPTELIEVELTQPETIKGCCKDVDVVISTVGITKQKDGLTYTDVDYQANMNLLGEVQISGVKRFIYVSVLNGEHLRHLKMMRFFTGSKIYGPIEFFLTVMSMDMLAPEYGIFTLKDHFDKLKRMNA